MFEHMHHEDGAQEPEEVRDEAGLEVQVGTAVQAVKFNKFSFELIHLMM